MLAKTRTWEQCPQMLAGKAREKWQIDPILPPHIPPLRYPPLKSPRFWPRRALQGLNGVLVRMSTGISGPKLPLGDDFFVHKCRSWWTSAETGGALNPQEDVNGEKLTVKKWWIFGADFFTVYAELFTVYKGHKRWKKKTSRYWWSFSRLVFHGLPPLETHTSQTRTCQNGIFQRKAPSRRRLFRLDGAFPV